MRKEDRVTMAHGTGGRMTQQLIGKVFGERFSNPILDRMNDAALLRLGNERLALSTDGHVVSPLFFPGGDIGKIAVFGTVNDLAMMGAAPRWIVASFIIEEGLPMETLRRIADSMAEAAVRSGVQLVGGDTKVVERDKGDGVYIAVAGVGVVPAGIEIDAGNAKPGDVLLLNGSVGNHGMTIMILREGLAFDAEISSDAAPLNGIVSDLLRVASHTHSMRDASRGGLATTLNELALASGVGIEIDEMAIPVADPVERACALLGLDPLYVANEGVFVAIVPPDEADAALEAMRAHPLGRRATKIGQVVEAHAGRVVLRTALGARRFLGPLTGDLLPRIC